MADRLAALAPRQSVAAHTGAVLCTGSGENQCALLQQLYWGAGVSLGKVLCCYLVLLQQRIEALLQGSRGPYCEHQATCPPDLGALPGGPTSVPT